ncbi:MAG: hypothetical protein BGO31_12625 [Bacteroidetes bacterium 43-16]|mgnify:CR=1 FL=1|nr:MAG: hypothetical protein BGO31_12625 [Bacteroidetes bacterium 43-16]
MVAIINTGKSIRRAFQYNENKLRDGAAILLTIQNCPFNKELSTERLRLKMLEATVALRSDVAVNAVHISLNFSPKEFLSNEKMESIAKDYMDRIGFGNQPYFVYRHQDAGHDHCHIVTTNITLDGSRISLHHLGRLKSEPARIAIEQQYGLIKADDYKQTLLDFKPVVASKVVYGKTETKRAIANVLVQIIDQYRFTSIAELNAVLNLYNVHAETGEQGSRLSRFNGIKYTVVDKDGNPIGVPLKASLFHKKPTRRTLETLFVKNDVIRQKYKNRIQNSVNFLLKTKQPKSLEELIKLLHREDIRPIPRQNKDGLIYGLTYVDLKTKCVFNGSALGKQYSAKAILSAIHLKPDFVNESNEHSSLSVSSGISTIADMQDNVAGDRSHFTPDERSLMELLTRYEYVASGVPYDWRKKKKKRKRR